MVDGVLVMLAAYLILFGAERLGYVCEYDALVVVVYFFYNAGFLYAWEGQSPGRRTVDITVVSADGGRLGPVQAVLRSVVRPIFCFAPEKLLKTGALAIDPAYTFAVIVVELFLMAFIPGRRTVADLVSRAIVVNTPPPQPHRAPAVPMYSAGDAEFGLPPRAGPDERGKRE